MGSLAALQTTRLILSVEPDAQHWRSP